MIRKKSNTCICAVKSKRGKIWIAADRKASWDFSKAQSMPRPKIIKRDGVILGGTGSGYLCTLMVDILTIPERKKESLDIYIHMIFKEHVREELINQGYTEEHNLLKIPKEEEAEILIVIEGHLYSMIICNPDEQGDYSNGFGMIMIDEVGLPFGTGCGGQIAWGALLENADLYIKEEDKDPRKLTEKERLIRAVEKACEVSPGCGLPIDVLSE